MPHHAAKRSTPPTIRFTATLQQPAPPGGSATPAGAAGSGAWSFLVLPPEASAQLPSRGMVSVKGTLNGRPFQATFAPDGQGGHWLKVDRKGEAPEGTRAGDTVTLEITPVPPGEEPEPTVPPDLRNALAKAPGAAGAKIRATWSEITPLARRDWIQWITSGKRAETRAKRIDTALDMLAKGKRRPCCFDRSGMYGKSAAAPCPMPGIAERKPKDARP